MYPCSHHRLRILSLCCTFPSPLHEQLGIFVRARLRQVAALADVRVVAPVAVAEYGNPARRWFNWKRISPSADGSLHVEHPRWIYLPFGGPLNAVLLFSQLVYRIARIRKEYPFDILDAHFGFPDTSVRLKVQ